MSADRRRASFLWKSLRSEPISTAVQAYATAFAADLGALIANRWS
jgi:hypothetical protein